ncbi:hypothetical protein [Chitinophaga rhizophila]|uniref:Uncharacterized protein n=1 Tax=Chitinophaga rhizophila TaxID=2866212 RepID=A0ABS7GMN1_9BACT|nr:hypothetical protein [Chitinophaga rhizophila]MBW8688127.1 hypothetical protein [Chitinophaga rhizophila]
MNFRNLFGGRKSRKAAIHNVSFTDFGWTKRQESDAEISWVHPSYPAVLSINYFQLPPDVPYMADVSELRTFYRNMVIQSGGGLIQVDVAEIKGVRSIITLFKMPREGNGIHYIGAITIPFHDCSYVVKIQAVEDGPTGMREAMIAPHLIEQGTITVDQDGVKGWAADPYDSTIIDGLLMNLSESITYDEQFAQHPLSIVRNRMQELINSIQIAQTLV